MELAIITLFSGIVGIILFYDKKMRDYNSQDSNDYPVPIDEPFSYNKVYTPQNLRAFLMMIRFAEGTQSSDGYSMMFGGKLFNNGFLDHPRIAHQFTDKSGKTLWTTAAGAYQFLAVSPLPNGSYTKTDTWDSLKRKLNLPDFSPPSQDLAAIDLIKSSGAMGDIESGNIRSAIDKCKRVWASLPGAGYNQNEQSYSYLLNKFVEYGGILSK